MNRSVFLALFIYISSTYDINLCFQECLQKVLPQRTANVAAEQL